MQALEAAKQAVLHAAAQAELSTALTEAAVAGTSAPASAAAAGMRNGLVLMSPANESGHDRPALPRKNTI